MNDANAHVKIAERVSTRLKLKQLQLLVAISEHKSILHAAGELNMSQPAATKLIKDLEADFAVQLFERTNRGVVPTVHGEALIRHGKLILSQISHAAQELDDLNEGLGGRVVVGTLLAASAKLLPLAIERLRAQRPNVHMIVRDGTNDILMPALAVGDVDLVVGRLPEYRHRRDVVQEKLHDEHICIVARSGHPLAGAETVELKELAKCGWILPPPPTTLRRQIDKEFFDRGLETPANAVDSISFLTNRGLLMATDMLCPLPYHTIEPELDAGTLTIIPCRLNLTVGSVGASYRRIGLSPAASAFLEELRLVAGSIGSD